MKIKKIKVLDSIKKELIYCDIPTLIRAANFWNLVQENELKITVFIGKLDINGKEIWEGDRVKTVWSSHDVKYGTIVWDERGLGSWGILFDNDSEITSGNFLNSTTIEVITDLEKE